MLEISSLRTDGEPNAREMRMISGSGIWRVSTEEHAQTHRRKVREDERAELRLDRPTLVAAGLLVDRGQDILDDLGLAVSEPQAAHARPLRRREPVEADGRVQA